MSLDQYIVNANSVLTVNEKMTCTATLQNRESSVLVQFGCHTVLYVFFPLHAARGNIMICICADVCFSFLSLKEKSHIQTGSNP